VREAYNSPSIAQVKNGVTSFLSLYAPKAWAGTALHIPNPLSFNNPMQSMGGAGIGQSVQRLALGWTVRGSNLGGARFSAPVQTGSEAHPASYTTGTGSFPGVKRPGVGVDHPPHLGPRLKKEWTYTSTPPLGLRSLFLGEIFTHSVGVMNNRRE
jgi:hypothetical protein